MDKIASSIPQDKTAAMVTGKGTHFDPKIKPSSYTTTDIKPPTWKGTHGTKLDLKGIRCGRFVVIGLSSERPSRWVVRCDCGNYEFRTAKAIRNPANAQDRCQPCRKLQHIQERDAGYKR